MSKEKEVVNNFSKCMLCDRESYQAGRFISNNMNLIQILCKEHFIKLLDAQGGLSIERFDEASKEARAENVEA